MTELEAIEKITSVKKYYHFVGMKQPTASRIVISIRNGSAKEKTKRDFFAKFNYSYEYGRVTPL